jgi:hypothetical protein
VSKHTKNDFMANSCDVGKYLIRLVT